MLCNKMDNPLFFITETKSTDLYNFVLDPLSVIIKLAIINNKSIGTKIHIDNHIMTFQDPGPFQGLCRLMLHLWTFKTPTLTLKKYKNVKSILMVLLFLLLFGW